MTYTAQPRQGEIAPRQIELPYERCTQDLLADPS